MEARPLQRFLGKKQKGLTADIRTKKQRIHKDALFFVLRLSVEKKTAVWYDFMGCYPARQKEIWKLYAMYYSAIGFIAIFVLCIENIDILLGRRSGREFPAWIQYRRFLIAVLIYYVSDILWGVLESQKQAPLLYIDTVIYFLVMAVGTMLWTRFTVSYLNAENVSGRILVWFGRVFCAAVAVIVGINFVLPVLFTVDSDSVYTAGTLRYVMFAVQIVLLLVISIFAFFSMARQKGAYAKRLRSIAFFGLIMDVFIIIQFWMPYLPMYSMAYMTGTCLLHTFVVNDEKQEYKYELEGALEREKRQYEELRSARRLAYQDALTGVQSKLAFVEVEEKIDEDIAAGRVSDFAVAVFDLNDLKKINDRLGHEKGDQLIVDASSVIRGHFPNSRVFRIGGDEFAAVLEGEDYLHRTELLDGFNRDMDDSTDSGRVMIAAGLSEFTAGRDERINDVFDRADQLMYVRKQEMKSGTRVS